jgi:hypothetical protein
MQELYQETLNPLYLTGIGAVEFSKSRREYPGSHNIDFDRKMFEEFKELNDERFDAPILHSELGGAQICGEYQG